MAGSKKTLSIEMRLRDFASKNLDKIQGKTARMAAKMVKGFKKVGKAITSVKGLMVGFIAVLAVRRVASFVLGIVEAQDKLSKMARSIQSTTEELSSFQFALERSGLEVSKAATLLRAFGTARSLAFRAEDKGLISDQTTAFKLLGVSINDLKRKGTIEIIRQMAKGIEDLGDISAAQTALQSIFPRDFQAITNLLGEGVAAFDKLISGSKRFGATLSSEAGLEAEKFIDTMTNFSTVISSTFRDLVNLFLPDIGRIIEGLTETLVDNRDAFIGFAKALIDFIKAAATQAFGAIIATFQAIDDLLNRTTNDIEEDIARVKRSMEQLRALAKSTGVDVEKVNFFGNNPDLDIIKLRDRLKELSEELENTNFGKAQKAAEAFAKAMANVGLAIDGTRISLKDALKNAESLKAALEEGIDAKAITEPGLSQAVGMTSGFREATIAIRDARNELVTMNEEGKKLLDTARQLEALPAAFIGPERAGQKRKQLPEALPRPRVQTLADILNTQSGLPPPAFLSDGSSPTPFPKKLTEPDLSGFDKFNEGVKDALAGLENLRDAGADLVFSLADGLGGAMTSFLDGTLSAKEAFKQFAKDLLKQLAQIIIKLAIAKALQAALGGAGGAVGGAKEGGVFPEAAKGGVFPEFGGRFAGGGIAPGRSQLINVGEGGRREAVVPLPDNRSIPVDLRGAGGFNITNKFFFQGSSGESLEQVRRNKDQIIAIITTSIKGNEGGIRRTIQEIGK